MDMTGQVKLTTANEKQTCVNLQKLKNYLQFEDITMDFQVFGLLFFWTNGVPLLVVYHMLVEFFFGVANAPGGCCDHPLRI